MCLNISEGIGITENEGINICFILSLSITKQQSIIGMQYKGKCVFEIYGNIFYRFLEVWINIDDAQFLGQSHFAASETSYSNSI